MTKDITLLQALATMPVELAEALADFGEAMARQSAASGEWSLADILAHLLDVEIRYRARLVRVLREESPRVPSIWPDQTDHNDSVDLDEVINQFRVARMETLALLEQCTPDDWQRPATHETFGRIDVRFLVQNLVDHDTLHLNQMLEVKQNLQLKRAETVVET